MLRRLVLILLLLIISAAVEILLAWMCMALEPGGDAHPLTHDEAKALCVDVAPQFADEPAEGFTGSVRWGFGWSDTFAGDLQRPQTPTGNINLRRYEAGWPRHAFTGRTAVMPDRSSRIDTMFAIGPKQFRSRARRTILPYGPIWTGHIVNTLCFAAMISLLIMGWITAKHRMRLRTRRCPFCAYPFGDSPVCTECGRDVSKWIQPHRPQRVDGTPRRPRRGNIEE